eukprot:12440-Pelagococcus_subviridis.AAC.5
MRGRGGAARSAGEIGGRDAAAAAAFLPPPRAGKNIVRVFVRGGRRASDASDAHLETLDGATLGQLLLVLLGDLRGLTAHLLRLTAVSGGGVGRG